MVTDAADNTQRSTQEANDNRTVIKGVTSSGTVIKAWLSGFAALLSVAISSAVLIYSFTSNILPAKYGYVYGRVKDSALVQIDLKKLHDELHDEQKNEIAQLGVEIDKLKTRLDSLSNIPKEDKLYLQLQKLSSSAADLKVREDKLEAVILSNPSKALEVPLLQRDLDSIKTAQQTNIIAFKDSVDRIYDLNKWLVGAMAISVITLAIGNFLKSKE
jgi:glutamine synthetase type III